MAESNLLASFLPLSVPESPGNPTTPPDDCEVEDSNPSVDLEILYPEGASSLPLAGGAVVGFGYSNPGEQFDATSFFSSEINAIAELNETGDRLDLMTRVRNTVNASLKSIGKKDAIRKNAELPKLYISTYVGDDSEFANDTETPVAGVVKICELTYIPLDVLKAIAYYVGRFENLENVAGVSGETFGYLGLLGANNSLELDSQRSINSAETLALVMEFFTIYNISENDIVKRGLNTTLGGFYTFNFDNKSFYAKLPDLSGKDSFGFAPDIWDDRNIYLEAILNSSLQRVKIEDFSFPPSIDFAGDFPDEFPESGSLEITVETNKELTSGYLSVVIPNPPDISNISGIRASTDAIELYSIPLLTQPVIKGKSPTFSILEDFDEFYHLSTRNYIEDIYQLEGLIGNLVTKGNIEQIGIANGLDVRFSEGNIENFTINQSTFWGEKNRPEVLLFDNDRKSPRRSNNRKYWSSNITEARTMFANVRPKIYSKDQIPELWLKTSETSEDADGNTVFTFSATELDLINKDNLDNISFIFYAQDVDGQFARAPGVLSLEIGTPAFNSVTPTGFADSNEVSPFETARLTFRGDNLSAINKLNFTSVAGQTLTFEKGSDADTSIVISSSSISFNTYKTMQELGFTATTTYTVFGETELGKTSSGIEIYISDGDGGQLEKQPQLPDFTAVSNIMFFANKEKYFASEIPIDPGQTAEIKVKSKRPYFNGDYSMFAYLAVDSSNADSLSQVEIPSNLIEVMEINVPTSATAVEPTSLTIASTIKYEFSESFAGQDFYKIGNKKAGLKIPGDEHGNRNFNALIDASQRHDFYIIFTALSIEELTAEESTIDEESYFVLKLGDIGGEQSRPAFVPPPAIIGLAAIPKGSAVTQSNFTISEKYNVIYDEFGTSQQSAPGNISAYDKLSNLAIVFYGDNDTNGNRRYKFFIGSDKINGKLSGKIQQIEGTSNEYVAFFRNITIKDTGDLSVYLTKKNKDYKITSSSETIKRRATYFISGEDVTYDTETSELVIADGTDIDGISDGNTSGYIKNSDALQDSEIVSGIIPSSGSGIALTAGGTSIDFIQPVDMTSNFDFRFISGNTNINLLKNIKETDIESIDKSTMLIPGGTRIPSSSIVIDNQDATTEAAAFLNLEVGNPQAISFNKPEILGIRKGNSGVTTQDDPSTISIEGGEEYSILVKSSDRRFNLLFGDLYIARPKDVKPVSGQENVFRAKFKAPKKLVGSDCPEIAASVSNAGRNAAKFQLGDKFVVDAQKKMLGFIDGVNKVKIPDLDDLKQLISDFPLRFVSLKLDQVSIPTDLINSFCDMSFHLTADLKIALNGFQILMIPIQVIFCIIDVICALLNPFKVAKAVIRLFQCLYDLILLLPVISVPVMYLQLILHILKLLECILEKILTIITVINEIINAIQLAVDGALWDALKSLEETLSEYLLDIKADLSVLDPIVSILAIFLQLLGLAFRFPCSITDEQDEYFCMDGSMLGGLVIGKALNDDESYRFDALLPVGQAYSDKTLEEAFADNTSDPLIDPEDGNLCAVQDESLTYLDSMEVDSASLRSTYASNGGDFNLTFSASATKSKKGFGKPGVVRFQFKEKGRNGFFNKKKIIDPEQTLDGPIYLTRASNNELKIETGNNRNLISPIDGVKFLDIDNDNDTASVKPLELEIEIPITEIDEETGEEVVVGTETIPRTFDNIPKMALLDEEFNVYFIEPDGIEFKDGYIDSIKAKIVNVNAAEKKKFLKEDVEIDTDDDGEEDDEAPVYDFPQIHFFDMREVAEDIESKCGFDFFNNDLLEDDPDDIIDIVEEGQDCIEEYQAYISAVLQAIRDSMIAGEVPNVVDVEEVQQKGQELEDCLNGSIDKICIYVVNSLNSQFKILEDSDETPLTEFRTGDPPEELTDGFEIEGPTLTGAREYAAGIGDSAKIPVGESATIQITPRDSYDNTIPGDLSSKIILEIISDTTDSASFTEQEDGSILTTNGEDYFASLTAESSGIVKIRAKICNKTIQAVTYAEAADELLEDDIANVEVDCVPEASDAEDVSDNTGALGALTKVDRILTVNFVKGVSVALSDTGDKDPEGSLAKAEPQAFGSELEN